MRQDGLWSSKRLVVLSLLFFLLAPVRGYGLERLNDIARRLLQTRPETAGSTFTVGVIGDPHVGLDRQLDLERLQFILTDFKAKNPVFIAVLGDLTVGRTNPFIPVWNATEKSVYYLLISNFMNDSGIPVFSLPGNHDVGIGEWPDVENRTKNYVDFVDGYQYQGQYGYFDYPVVYGNYYFLFLDNVQKPRNNIDTTNDGTFQFTSEQYERVRLWIANAADSGRGVFAFAHISPLHGSYPGFRGENGLFGLLYGNALASFNGHEHRPSEPDPQHSDVLGPDYVTSPIEWFSMHSGVDDDGVQGGFAELMIHERPQCGYRLVRTGWDPNGTLVGPWVIYQGGLITSPQTITGYQYYDEVPMDIMSPITVEGPSGHLRLDAFGKQQVRYARIVSRNGGMITISGRYCPQ